MPARIFPVRAAMLCIVGLLAACTRGEQAGFAARYDVARSALEAGETAQAIAGYRALLPEAGPLEPRLRLELAHALLRAGDYTAAAHEAGSVAQGAQPAARAAALAVKGTAEHELARAALATGDGGRVTQSLLVSARAALGEALAAQPGLDPMGALAARRAEIGGTLQRLGAEG